MTDILDAVKNGDYIKTKNAFYEAMEKEKEALLEARKLEIAQGVMIEGEEEAMDDDEDEQDEKEDKEEKED